MNPKSSPSPTEPKAPAPVATSSGVFVSTLAALDHGQSLVDLDDALRDLTRRVQEMGVKGKLTYTVEVIPNGVGVGDIPLFRVVDDLKVSLPKKKRSGQTFFADEENNLTRRHPGQAEMKLTLVPAGKPAQGMAAAAQQSAQ